MLTKLNHTKYESNIPLSDLYYSKLWLKVVEMPSPEIFFHQIWNHIAGQTLDHVAINRFLFCTREALKNAD